MRSPIDRPVRMIRVTRRSIGLRALKRPAYEAEGFAYDDGEPAYEAEGFAYDDGGHTVLYRAHGNVLRGNNQ